MFFSFAVAKVGIFFDSTNFLQIFYEILFDFKKMLYLCTRKTETECSAVGSALRSGRRGRAFESPHSDRRAADDSISFAALSYYSSVINNFVIILCGMRLFISLQMIG